MSKLKRKQYCWTMDEYAEGYCCVFLYVRQNEKLTHDEEVRLDFDNPNHAISFHKLLIEAGYNINRLTLLPVPNGRSIKNSPCCCCLLP